MPDEMFFISNGRGLRRGKRRERRTPTCRPCLIWPLDAPEIVMHGVVLDVNAHGMLIRMLDSVPLSTEIKVQIMMDESFSVPLTAPFTGAVVRNDERAGFVDHGVKLEQRALKRNPAPRVTTTRRTAAKVRQPTRMHTIDFTVGDRRQG